MADNVFARVDVLEAGHKQMAIDLKAIKENTQEMNDLLHAAHGLLTFLAVLAKIATWIGKVGVAVAIVWGLVFAYKHGTPPPNVSP